jgi:hypothetical protein
MEKLLTAEDKKRMKYFEVETMSHSRKSYGVNMFYAENKADAIAKMKKKKLPVFKIKEIEPPEEH